MIIPIQINHLNEIVHIENCAFNKPWTINQIKNDIKSSTKSENWVYIIDGLVVGYIFGKHIYDEFHLNNIAVHPKYIRRNIGRELIWHLISIVKSYNVTAILLEVSEKNIPAQKCYKSIGFYKVGIRRNYYSKGDNAILYNLDLKQDG